MNDIEQVEAALHLRVPDVITKVSAPRDPLGSWFLDVRLGEKFLPIEWRARHGDFGISTSDDQGYGEGPEEVFTSVSTITDRVVDWLTRPA